MTTGDVDGWKIEVEEMSVNVFSVKAVSKSGEIIEKTGVDPEKIISEIKSYLRSDISNIRSRACARSVLRRNTAC
jgi:hypothetical protein